MDKERYRQIEYAYSVAAEEYAKQFFYELDGKPLDRKLLEMFGERVGFDGKVCEVGCGPGEVSVFLSSLGVNVYGIDLSQGMVDEAIRLSPQIHFERGDMLNLKEADNSLAGIVGFYAIVNIPHNDLKTAFGEFARVLQPSGTLLISFHVGDKIRHVEDFMEKKGASLDFIFHRPELIEEALREAGFVIDEVIIRAPYTSVEHPSQRCYIFAHKRCVT